MGTIGVKELTELKEDIESAKTNVATYKGQEKTEMQQLLDLYKCKTTKEAVEKIEEIKENIKTLQDQIDEGTEELEEKYTT